MHSALQWQREELEMKNCADLDGHGVVDGDGGTQERLLGSEGLGKGRARGKTKQLYGRKIAQSMTGGR